MIPLAPSRLRTRYRAVIELISGTELRATAWQSPGIQLDTIYELIASQSGTASEAETRLSGRVSIHAPFGLRRFVHGQARASHATQQRARCCVADRCERSRRGAEAVAGPAGC